MDAQGFGRLGANSRAGWLHQLKASTAMDLDDPSERTSSLVSKRLLARVRAQSTTVPPRPPCNCSELEGEFAEASVQLTEANVELAEAKGRLAIFERLLEQQKRVIENTTTTMNIERECRRKVEVGFSSLVKQLSGGGTNQVRSVVTHHQRGEPSISDDRNGFSPQEMKVFTSIPPHPNIVGVASAWDTPQDVAIALELACGDMHAAFSQRSMGHLFDMMVDVCQGIAHVRENGFVHSDIKFENVLLEEVAHGRCIAKLSDFGLAYENGELKPGATRALGFLPPENIKQPVVAHQVQDAFAIGAMLVILMVRPELSQPDKFQHPMLWSLEEKDAVRWMTDQEKEAFLEELSFRKMNDTSETGFMRTMLRPENLRPFPTAIKIHACSMLSSMVHPDASQRPDVGTVGTFAKLSSWASRRMTEARLPRREQRNAAGTGSRWIFGDDGDG